MLRLQSTISSWREYLSPISHVSTFKKTGEITPEEFVQAGDYLVYKFPTWSWAGAAPSRRRDFLPADKQCLVTKHVACRTRASGADTADVGGDDDEDGEWSMPTFARAAAAAPAAPADDEIMDIDDFDEDPAALPVDAGAGGARSYNLYITYSTSYRVPKMYLSGFGAGGSPLTPDEMFEDIVSEYKDRTVTIETAPFDETLTVVGIHPCRHAGVMKMLIQRAERRRETLAAAAAAVGLDGDEAAEATEADWEEVSGEDTQDAVRVDQYLVIFLKFIASVTPGIEHDNTMSAL
ncbi:autophagocytosis associated protein [Dipodascopsis tothii]|uniref:autophagocytosis associated protein n=1 Tax=Dipodascopsis tothii TaxID=44089 RepID=UPI0034CF49BA